MTFQFIKSETLIRLIKVGNYFILFLPLVVIPGFVFPYVFPRTIFFQIIVEAILPFYFLLMWQEPKLRPKLNALNFSVLAFLAVFILSTIFSQDRLMSFWGGLEWHNGLFLMLHLVAWFFMLQIFSRQQFLGFLKFSVGIGFFVCLTAVCQLIGLFFPPTNAGRVYGVLGNPSFLSVYLIFHLFITALAFLADKNLNWRVFCSFNFIINLIIFALCQTRGAILGLLVGFFVAGVIYVIFYAKKYRKILIGAVVALTLLGGLWLYSFYQKTQADPLRSKNVMTRVMAWQAAWRGWQEHFFFGYGSENFYLAFNKNFDPEYLTYSTSGGLGYEAALNFPHNKIIEIGLSHGIFGVIAYSAIFVSAIFTLYKKKRDNHDFLIITALFAAYFVQNLFLFDVIFSFLMFFLVLAYINSRQIEIEKLAETQMKAVYLAVWGIICLVIFYVMIKENFLMLRDSYLSNKGWFEYKKNNFETAVGAYRKLYERHSYVTDKACDDLEVFAAVLMRNNLENKQAQEFYQFALSEVETCLKRHDKRISVYIQLAELNNAVHENNPESMKKAEALLLQAKDLAPRRPEIYMQLGQTKLYQEDETAALDYLRQAVALNDKFYIAHFYLGKAYVYYERYDEAVAEYEKTIALGYNARGEIAKIAATCIEKKNYDLAKKYYARLIELDPNNHAYKEELEKLSKIK